MILATISTSVPNLVLLSKSAQTSATGLEGGTEGRRDGGRLKYCSVLVVNGSFRQSEEEYSVCSQSMN